MDYDFDDYLKNFICYAKVKCLFDVHRIKDTDIRKDISKYVSKMLTGIENSEYTSGLQDKMFTKSYNFYVEWNWVVNDFCSKYTCDLKIANVHYLYASIVNRVCDIDSLRNIITNNTDLFDVKNSLLYSTEKKCIEWKNAYCDDSKYSNCSRSYYRIDETTITLVNSHFFMLLNYLPSEVDLKNLYPFRNDRNFEEYLLNYIKQKSDFRYIQECLEHFNSLSKCDVPNKNNAIKIKYYGPVGTSGYAKATKSILARLCKDSRFDIKFCVTQFQNYNKENESDDMLLSLLNKKKDCVFDYIVIHSTPDLFPIISNLERKINKNVLVYAVSVWETETLPSDWIECIKYVDKISVPSNFSAISFRKECDIVDVVFHPVYKKECNPDCCMISSIKHKFSHIFYNISEWTNRKGIAELIDTFIKAFGTNKKILLYIKTFGDVTKKEGVEFIVQTLKKYHLSKFLDNVILDYARVSDSYIDCIHKCADTYISLTKSEGQGIGVCYSVLHGNNCIVTNYSGHLDYLKDYNNVYYVNYTMEPATFCSVWSNKHFDCRLLPHCRYFDKFVPHLDSWAAVDTDHAMQLMKQVITIGQVKNTTLPISVNFCDDFYKSLTSTIRNKNISVNRTEITSVLDYLPQQLLFRWKTVKTILVVNAGNFGNVGDFCYSYILNQYFSSGDYRLIFISDSELHKDFVHDFDYLIIGGGGLLNLQRLKKENLMWQYAEYAMKYSIPVYLVSLGFQDCNPFDVDLIKYTDYQWLLNGSDYISVRSAVDYMIAYNLVKKETREFIYVYPDLVYSLDKYILFTSCHRNILLVVLDKNWITLGNAKHYIDSILAKRQDLKLVFTEFTGVHDGINAIDFDKVKQVYPVSEIVSGLHTEYSNTRTSTLQTFVDLLCKTDTIISGRYHSGILASVYKVPNVVNFNYQNYKIVAENISSLDNSKALDPLNTIKYFIDTGKTFTNPGWDETDRNDAILHVSKARCIPVEIAQNWGNRVLDESL